MNQIQTLWEKTLQKICLDNQITDISYKQWFQGLEPLRYHEDIFYILADNNFIKGVLENRYKDSINSALSETIGTPCQVQILLNTEDMQPAETIPIVNDELPQENFYNGNNGPISSSLNPKYTFDTFVTGESNRFAYAACRAVSDKPSVVYNPLFLIGGVGLGKTHLMQAIGSHICYNQPELKVVYVSSEAFTNDFIEAIQNKNNNAFRNKYRKVDVLLIDDIQFLAGREGTQEEFFHTFNALYHDNKQIVLSSDRPAREIKDLEERLRSRFEMGLTSDISEPNLETRIAILKKKAESIETPIPSEVFVIIANTIQSNIRELEGALTTVEAYSKLRNIPVSVESAQEALRDVLKNKEKKELTPNYIKEVTAQYFNVTSEDLESKRRHKAVTVPRQVAMYIIREVTDLSLPKIGDHFGGRDHSTVLHSCDKVLNEMKSDQNFKSLIQRIMNEIKS